MNATDTSEMTGTQTGKGGMKLYELTGQFQELLDVMQNTDDADGAIRDTLEGITGEMSIKILSCAAVVRTLIAESEAVGIEEERLHKRAKSLANNADALKRYMADAMTTAGLDKVKDAKFTVAFQANAPRVVLDCPDEQLPVGYFRTKIEADKSLIGERLKAGETFIFAHLETSRSLRIR